MLSRGGVLLAIALVSAAQGGSVPTRHSLTILNSDAPAALASVVVAGCMNATDCTAELQAALDSCAPIVTVPALPERRSWIVRPIAVSCDGQTIDFAAGAVLQAMRGEFHKGQGTRLFTIQNRSGITVLGNGGATFRMWRGDYGNAELYTHSEGRHGVAVYGSRDVTLRGLTVTETGGDGVYISNILGQPGTPNRNISILNCNLTGNYRNAISVISVERLRVENTILALSKGTSPQVYCSEFGHCKWHPVYLSSFLDIICTLPLMNEIRCGKGWDRHGASLSVRL